MCKNFIVFNIHRWSKPRKLNMDYTLHATLCTSSVGRATMDMLRTLDKERRNKLVSLETVLQTHSLN